MRCTQADGGRSGTCSAIGREQLAMVPRSMIPATTSKCTRKILLVSRYIHLGSIADRSDEVIRGQHLSILTSMG